MTLHTCPSCALLVRPGVACPGCGASAPTVVPRRHPATSTLLALVAVSGFIACSQEMYGIAYTDDDGDGHSVPFGDCDDTDPDVNPAAVEVPGNGVDDDCDGAVDEGEA